MTEAKCDNNDPINWEQRAKIMVFVAKASKLKRKEVLEGIKDNEELTKWVKKYWPLKKKSKMP